jgi:competence protein ComEC
VVSAFVMLIFNPFLIAESGFQLSYFAVFGIVFLQPELEKIWTPKFFILKKIWILITVSIAAQLSLLPLSLFYFNKFPVYFILTNLLVIPLATLIMYCGILFYMSSFSSMLGTLAGKLLAFLVKALNLSIGFVDQLPFSVIDRISLSSFEVILLYIFIISCVLAILKRYKVMIWLLMFSLLTWCFNSITKSANQLKTEKVIVYKVHNGSAYDFIKGRSHVFIADSIVFSDRSSIDFNVRGSWIDHRLKNTLTINLDQPYIINNLADFNLYMQSGFIQFCEIRIMVMDDKENRLLNSDKVLKMDIMILRNNPFIDFEKLKRVFDPGIVIFDSSNSWWRINKWKALCKKYDISCYSVSDNGAFIQSF